MEKENQKQTIEQLTEELYKLTRPVLEILKVTIKKDCPVCKTQNVDFKFIGPQVSLQDRAYFNPENPKDKSLIEGHLYNCTKCDGTRTYNQSETYEVLKAKLN